MNLNIIFKPVLALLLTVASAGCTTQKLTQQSGNWTMTPFVRGGSAPVILPDTTTVFPDPMSGKPVHWEASDTFNPAAAVMGDSIYVLYRAEDMSGIGIGKRTSRLGIASSADGISMRRDSKPVLYPANDDQKEMEWPGGCEDPRVARTEDGTFVMLYTQWNRKVPRLAVATSKDLRTWKKHGPAFKRAHNGRFADMASKSGSVVTRLKGNKQVITKVNGKYLMYWGERFINPAVSTDLINWEPLLNESGNLLHIAKPRKGYFDSDLTECGPPAVMTDKGILLLYNGKNSGGETRDKRYTANTYAAGQILFDSKDFTKVLNRLDEPFLVPREAYEKSGQYPAGTVFIEGLVYFKKKWFLYYGCADSRVAVAVFDPAQ
ncbi:glycoside hydrolase family 130 protein [Pedobacter faecalis]|uniref:glycoside hydrolase family 130 protein n=1 Tax=Pedobacter faecalis TaxID=3041495 RepID=UPI00254FEB3D|nr:glycoside hydrolase family 130 protein [Pedobacter sp. ELA7]